MQENRREWRPQIRKSFIMTAGARRVWRKTVSGNVNLSRDLGMRHRAGIGISETSDAVVAIVSEETGTISVAINGMLKRHLSPETLEKLLRSELLPEPEEKNSTAVRLTGVFKGKKGDKKNGKEDSRQ